MQCHPPFISTSIHTVPMDWIGREKEFSLHLLKGNCWWKLIFFFSSALFFNLIARYIWLLLWSVELSLRCKSWNYTWGLKLVPQSDEVHYSLNFTPGLTPMRWTSNIPHSWQSSCHSESDWQGLCAFIVWGRHHGMNSQAPCLSVKPDTTKEWFHWSQFSKVHSTFECHIWYLHRQL